MPDTPTDPGTDQTPFAGMGCPKCGYDLTGIVDPRCPECGGAFDPARLRPVSKWRRVPLWAAIPCVLLATYLPNTWVFWIDYPWNGYRLTWVKMFPLLPSLFPSAWLAYGTGLGDRMDDTGMFLLAGGMTVFLIAVGVFIARRSWWWLASVCVVLLAFEVFNAFVSHGLFRM